MIYRDRQTTSPKQKILDYLVQNIQDRKFQVGDKLFSEHFVAKKLGVNRSAVHQVYTALELMGIVESVHGEGTFLRRATSVPPGSPLSLLLLLQDANDAKVLEFRRIIEVGIVDDVLRNIEEKEIRAMRDSLHILKTTADYEQASAHDVRIHYLFCQAVQNPLITFVYNMALTYIAYIADSNWEKIATSESRELRPIQVAQHEAIIDAVDARDAKACKQAIFAHLDYIAATWGEADPAHGSLPSL